MPDLYVGNLNFETTEEQIRALFVDFGAVRNVRIINDPATQRPKGFGFVSMQDQQGADRAAEALDGREFMRRNLTVRAANARPEKPGYRQGYREDKRK